MLSNDDAIAKFKEIIGNQDGWQYLKESQFVNHMAIFQGWALVAAQYGVERALQEYFLSTALNPSSIMAHAEDRGYVPRKPRPASGTITITNNGPNQVSLSATQGFSSGAGLKYLIQNAATIAPAYASDIEIQQLEKFDFRHVITETKSYYEIIFDSALAPRIHGVDVSVELSPTTSSEGYIPWSLSRLFQNASPDAMVYDEFFSHTGQIGIRFGNGEFGMRIPTGANVLCTLWLTDGDTVLISGQGLNVSGAVLDIVGDPAQLDIIASTQICGGVAGEGIEELRRSLQYWPLYQEQLVWREDYIFFIKKQFPEILWINVWGETEAEDAAGRFDVDFVNKIFISAYAQDDAQIGAAVMAHLASVRLLNRRFEWVPPVIFYFTVAVSGVVNTRYAVGAVVQSIQEILVQNYDINSKKRRAAVLIKDVYALIESTGFFMDSGYTVELSGSFEAAHLNEIVAIDIIESTFDITSAG